MSAIWFVIGAVAGGVSAWLLMRGRVSAAKVESKEFGDQRDDARQETAEHDREQAEARGELQAQIAGLKAERDAERRMTVEKLEALTEVREDLLAQVGKSAGEVLDGRGKQLVEQLKSELAATKAEASADMGKRQKAVEDLVKPLSDTMKQMGEAMEKVDIDRRKTHTELTQSLVSVAEAQKELRTETGALGRALRQPETRGRWGEMHLRRLFEMAGLSNRCDFTEQTPVDDDGKSLRPDVVVHLPGDKDIVVDSKAPLDPYLDACEATDEATRTAHMKKYASGLRAHVKKLASKEYASQFDSAPDFVLMYLPGEHFFSSAVQSDPALIEDSLRDGVLIATPTTLLVMLKTVAHSWQQEKLADEAQNIAILGHKLYERLSTYLEHVDRVSKCLNTLVDAQNKSVGSLEGRVLPAARQFPELGAVAANKRLPNTRQVNQIAREIKAPELGEEQGRAREIGPGDTGSSAADEKEAA